MNPEKALFELFDQLNINYKNYEHPPVFAAEEAVGICDHIPGAHCKNLFLKTKKNEYFLVVMLDEPSLDLKKFSEQIGVSRFSFASAERLKMALNVLPGSVTPFALMNDCQRIVKVFLDSEMMKHKILNYHPMRNDMTTGVSRDDFLKFLNKTGHNYKTVELPIRL